VVCEWRSLPIDILSSIGLWSCPPSLSPPWCLRTKLKVRSRYEQHIPTHDVRRRVRRPSVSITRTVIMVTTTNTIPRVVVASSARYYWCTFGGESAKKEKMHASKQAQHVVCILHSAKEHLF
jgi:hypothetical protein